MHHRCVPTFKCTKCLDKHLAFDCFSADRDVCLANIELPDRIVPLWQRLCTSQKIKFLYTYYIYKYQYKRTIHYCNNICKQHHVLTLFNANRPLFFTTKSLRKWNKYVVFLAICCCKFETFEEIIMYGASKYLLCCLWSNAASKRGASSGPGLFVRFVTSISFF